MKSIRAFAVLFVSALVTGLVVLADKPRSVPRVDIARFNPDLGKLDLPMSRALLQLLKRPEVESALLQMKLPKQGTKPTTNPSDWYSPTDAKAVVDWVEQNAVSIVEQRILFELQLQGSKIDMDLLRDSVYVNYKILRDYKTQLSPLTQKLAELALTDKLDARELELTSRILELRASRQMIETCPKGHMEVRMCLP